MLYGLSIWIKMNLSSRVFEAHIGTEKSFIRDKFIKKKRRNRRDCGVRQEIGYTNRRHLNNLCACSGFPRNCE